MDKNIHIAKYPFKRLKFVASINDEVLTEDTDPDFEINYIDIGNVDSTGKINEVVNYKFSDAPGRARRKVRQGDVIVSTVRTYLRAIASIENDVENLIVSTGFAVVRSKKDIFHPDFCKYALIESNFIDEVQKRSVGVSYPAINTSDLGDIFLPIPAYKAQISIIKYLGNELSKIDALIEKKTQLISILEEKKKAVINQAVIKGLDPTVSMKDSGIEWLGEIPEHWELVKLKYLTGKIGDGLHSTPEYTIDEEFYFINGVNLKNGKIELSEKTNTVSFEEFSKYKIDFSKKTIFLSLNGTIGNIAIYNNEKIILGKSAAFIDLGNGYLCNEFFLYYFLQSEVIHQYFEMSFSGTTIKNLSLFTLRNTPIVLPSIGVQLNIVSYLNKELSRLDYLNNKINDTIELLKEKRTAIISAAVNGELNASLS